MTGDPIFIVGVPRSGTTLLAAMLAAHSRLSCGPETHFFRRLAREERSRLVDPAAWPGPAVEFITSITHTGFTENGARRLIEKYDLTPEAVEQYLAARTPSIAAMLSSVTEPYMQAMGKSRWVEKTPDHIRHLGLIRATFPASTILRIVRDPRDVALSLSRLPWGAQTIQEGLLHWKILDAESEPFFATDAHTFTLRYEDLIESPEAALRKLCAAIGEDFEDGMLDTSRTGKQINTRNVPWKERASQPVDASRKYAWRKELPVEANRFAEAILGDRLERFDYPRQETFTRSGEVFPPALLTAPYAGPLQELACQGVRFWKTEPAEAPGCLVFLGDPDRDHWLTGSKLQRLVAAGRLLLQMRGQTVYWIPGQPAEERSGVVGRFLKRRLLRYRYPA